MEPNTQTNVNEIVPTTPNKNKKLYIVIIILIIAIIAVLLIRSKVMAPTNTDAIPVKLSAEDQKLNTQIDNATTFDNETDLQTIDKEF